MCYNEIINIQACYDETREAYFGNNYNFLHRSLSFQYIQKLHELRLYIMSDSEMIASVSILISVE